MNLPRILIGAMVASLTLLILSCTSDDSAGQANDSLQHILRQLQSEDVNARRDAPTSLGDFFVTRRASQSDGGKNLESTLAAIIADRDEDAQVRSLVVKGIGINRKFNRDSPVIREMLNVLIDETDDESVRSWTAMVLPETGPRDLVVPVIIKASASTDRRVAYHAMMYFSVLNIDQSIVMPIATKLMSEPSKQSKIEALSLSGRFTNDDEGALIILLKGLNAPEADVRQLALRIVQATQKGDNDKIRDALTRLTRSADPSNRSTSAILLMKMTGRVDEYISIPIEMLGEKDEATRIAAARSLTMCGPTGRIAVPVLEKALRDANLEVRVHAACALIRITERHGGYIHVLEKAKTSTEVAVISWASFYLAGLGMSVEED